MVSSVPIHLISGKRPGVELGPQMNNQLQGRVAGLLNHRRGRLHKNPRRGDGGRRMRTQAHHLFPILSPMHTLEGPERGLCSEKEYSRTWGFFVCFLLK